MFKYTRQTKQGWKTFTYTTEEDFQIGRPKKVRNARIDEIENAGKLIDETYEVAKWARNLLFEQKVPSKHPGMKLSKKKRTEIVKKARAGEDIGKPGKKFKEVAAKAAKQYGSKEAGARVAAAAMWKSVKETLNFEELPQSIQDAFEEEISKILEQEEKAVETSEHEGGAKDKWTIKDFADQIQDWKKAGYTDEKKLQGMIDRATEIAKKSTESAPGKATRAEVLGILQKFFQKK